ncbi:MAG: hypothetical protein JSR37_10240 [Verrucomicrobia bacterium]|nr:hypothetical protein [Verrucomicrobiota bacterium]MBS0637904.1 hypothetical protein [Verrucomicrobiota bacterium]
MDKRENQVDIVGSHAAMLSVTEVGLGSLLHSLHLPFSGHFLSLNQVFLLSRASAMSGSNGSRFMPGSISFVAAALKSLSPAGKKLTPMLAISTQGFLFNIGIFLFGNSVVGRIIGAAISSLWGFMQPLLLYYCMCGELLVQVIQGIDEFRRAWIPFDLPSVWYFIAALVSLKAALAMTTAYFAPKVSHQLMEKYTSRLSEARLKKKPITAVAPGQDRIKKVAILAAKDLCVWPFFACVTLGSISFWYAEGGISTMVVLNTLRPIAVGFLLFFAMRLLPMEKVAEWLEEKQLSLMGKAFRVALTKVRQM